MNLDLVEINPTANPPVCKLINYGKYIYKKNKNIKKNKQKKKINIKEIKFRLNTDKNDIKIKTKNIIKFLKKGNKVKITIRFKGREITHKNIAIDILNNIKNDLKKISCAESFSNKIENRQMTMILINNKKKINLI